MVKNTLKLKSKNYRSKEEMQHAMTHSVFPLFNSKCYRNKYEYKYKYYIQAQNNTSADTDLTNCRFFNLISSLEDEYVSRKVVLHVLLKFSTYLKWIETTAKEMQEIIFYCLFQKFALFNLLSLFSINMNKNEIIFNQGSRNLMSKLITYLFNLNNYLPNKKQC